ncbi:hypothetical protein EC973_004105 [Apophysomyces ossiformis]|uniref:Uncharacterized protein n=1 Tax=Apophysomyces ossiformis TaxID=679940 RepID=A0A8H7BGD3_9FUNG|nr:hypothetical protein EC973_004105 [Apophysomyces ossiformis]
MSSNHFEVHNKDFWDPFQLSNSLFRQARSSMNTGRWAYGVALLMVLGAGVGYYHVIEEDKQVKQRKRAKAAERHTLRQLQQINDDRQAIEKDIEEISSLQSDLDQRRREFLLAKSNELLLRLLERLDAIRPQHAIVGDRSDDRSMSDYEALLIEGLKEKKKRLIKRIQQDFGRVDALSQCTE